MGCRLPDAAAPETVAARIICITSTMRRQVAPRGEPLMICFVAAIILRRFMRASDAVALPLLLPIFLYKDAHQLAFHKLGRPSISMPIVAATSPDDA